MPLSKYSLEPGPIQKSVQSNWLVRPTALHTGMVNGFASHFSSVVSKIKLLVKVPFV